MGPRCMLLIVILLIASVQAEVSFIKHDQVQPFPQLKPTTNSERIAINCKPLLYIERGCYPYPAVNVNGSLNGGLEWGGAENGDCKGSKLGSQVYSRSASFRNKWAIMYAWYFPKSINFISTMISGQRHFWKFVIVWIDDPNKENSTMLGVSTPAYTKFLKKTPPKSKFVDGSSIKLRSDVSFWGSTGVLKFTTTRGELQNLITWEQLTDEARDSLSEFELNVNAIEQKHAQVPFTDNVFRKHLEAGWPF
ncbi:Necrosis inducing protein NPP1 [Phytophthora megakarya]|uniref:Necrosis inducing protein NPP1 n=1 Tax=Phytophthora megakarya TaxID=4795 RepID=A0A225WND9_9STRA|nr:Necrosis inducing protein NPP1 [Phytophthora megakarya]